MDRMDGAEMANYGHKPVSTVDEDALNQRQSQHYQFDEEGQRRPHQYRDDSRHLDVVYDPQHPPMVAVPIEQEDPKEPEEEKPKRPIFVPLMMLCCVVAFIVEIYLNDWKFAPMSLNPMIGPGTQAMIDAGAKDVTLIRSGQWYRLLSPMILHAGLIHLGMNMFSLRMGNDLEIEYGFWKLASLYILAGFAGTVASCVFLPNSTMVGASGAIFGLLGAFWADLVQNWKQKDKPCVAFFTLFLNTAINVVLGLMPFLDNFAHLGGLLAGFLWGNVVLIQTDTIFWGGRYRHASPNMRQLALQWVSFVLLVVALVAGVSVIYSRQNASSFCPGCRYLDCVPISNWWSCQQDWQGPTAAPTAAPGGGGKGGA